MIKQYFSCDLMVRSPNLLNCYFYLKLFLIYCVNISISVNFNTI